MRVDAEEVKVSDLTTSERDLYGDILRATARATAKGVEPSTIVSLMIAALVKEAVAQGIESLGQVVEGVRVAASHIQGALG